jgi:hypothetical protein
VVGVEKVAAKAAALAETKLVAKAAVAALAEAKAAKEVVPNHSP